MSLFEKRTSRREPKTAQAIAPSVSGGHFRDLQLRIQAIEVEQLPKVCQRCASCPECMGTSRCSEVLERG